MSHQEKQRIFDEYAKSQEFENWNDLKNFHLENDIDLDDEIFAACDLVQEQQQKRIAENAKMNFHDGVYKTNEKMSHIQYGADNLQVDKDSILNPENLIK
ncbi:hypothetical protein [Chryseobacterium sp. MYb328]|uniref:hypothetical protein n=1 Tax=Chryseobacterium sp. MYb328 TaxID=2745231 RepID=UPI0030A3B13C